MNLPEIIVEFFGVPRLRAGRATLPVRAASVRQALAAVAVACPRLEDLLGADGRLVSHYALSLDGQRFVTDLDELLRPGEHLLILSADAGG
jgi:hypothetical protein